MKRITYEQARQLYDIAMSNMILPIEWVKKTCEILHNAGYDNFVNKIIEKWQ